MAPAEVLSTALDIPLPKRWLSTTSLSRAAQRAPDAGVTEGSQSLRAEQPMDVDPEFKLPKMTSLVIMIVTNVMLQVSVYILHLRSRC